PDGVAGRLPEADGLRDRAAAGGGVADPDRDGHGDGALHLAGAGAGPPAVAGDGPVLAGGGGVRVPDGRPAVRRVDAGGGGAQARPGRSTRAAVVGAEAGPRPDHAVAGEERGGPPGERGDRKSTRLNSSHV